MNINLKIIIVSLIGSISITNCMILAYLPDKEWKHVLYIIISIIICIICANKRIKLQK